MATEYAGGRMASFVSKAGKVTSLAFEVSEYRFEYRHGNQHPTTRTSHQLIIGFGSLLSIYNFFAVVINTTFDFAHGSELRYCFAFSPIDPRRPGVVRRNPPHHHGHHHRHVHRHVDRCNHRRHRHDRHALAVPNLSSRTRTHSLPWRRSGSSSGLS